MLLWEGGNTKQTHRVTAHSSDDWLLNTSDSSPVAEKVRRVGSSELFVFHLLDVGTGCMVGRQSANPVQSPSVAKLTVFKDEIQSLPAKALSLPVSTKAPTSPSLSASSMAPFSSAISSEFNAFRALGRFRVKSATLGSGRETRIFV